MEIIKLTKAQVIAKLETEPLFILRFAVDNNPAGVVDSLNSNGVNTLQGTSSEALYNTLVQILNTDKAKAVNIITGIRYNPLVPIDNYTYGLTDYLRNIQPASTVTGMQKFNVDAMLSGLGAGLTAYTGVTLAEATAGEPKANTAEIEAKKKAEDEAKKKKTTTMIIWGVIIVVVLAVVIYFATRPKQTS